MKEKKSKWFEKMNEAKRKQRPKLKDWSKDAFATSRHFDFENFSSASSLLCTASTTASMLRLKKRANNIFESKLIDKISCYEISTKTFCKYYDIPGIPCIITDIPINDEWSAIENWTLKKLKHFKDCYFKVGEDDDGKKLKVKMRHFLKYVRYNIDDSPLYLFDGNFENDKVSKAILEDFKVPDYFVEDFFNLVKESKRPPYRWFLVGPQRSGTCLHIDPLGTSAWNTLIVGRKRWVLFPPGTTKSVAKGLDVIKKGEDDEAVNYFIDILPRIRAKYPDLMVVEFIQVKYDTVFVPGGWWHAVLNLEDTIAMTQNFCSRANFDRVWCKTRSSRKKMAVHWLKSLRMNHPDLAQRADQLNARDNFIMYSRLEPSSAT